MLNPVSNDFLPECVKRLGQKNNSGITHLILSKCMKLDIPDSSQRLYIPSFLMTTG